ncbi:hypothetical protein THAOC_09159 [Thalassiosira oceanica]|uniref:Uncharacterized protein n=1 Tax=Thalassiosira oceanica TaxID=159749 RepID=K0SVV8_THAOC|nr:hypothetical protein THAOC_09159 [Thalassiosira oceanica]|eukprot:EJK69565.1 hypothetical protein THAOC_09159 [Thalassiosira oceanica]
MHRRSSICPLRCAHNPKPNIADLDGHPPGEGDGPGGVAARFVMMSSVETAATDLNDLDGRSRAGHAGKSSSIDFLQDTPHIRKTGGKKVANTRLPNKSRKFSMKDLSRPVSGNSGNMLAVVPPF